MSEGKSTVRLALIRGAIALALMLVVLVVGLIWWNRFLASLNAMDTQQAPREPKGKVEATTPWV